MIYTLHTMCAVAVDSQSAGLDFWSYTCTGTGSTIWLLCIARIVARCAVLSRCAIQVLISVTEHSFKGNEVRYGAQNDRYGTLALWTAQGSVSEAGVRRRYRYAVTPLHA